jgi:hypothetical protein
MATDDLRREIAGERAQLSDAVSTLRSEIGAVADRGKKVGAAMGAAMGVATALRLALRLRRR